jgi:nucleosome binding factor SPN SPT16 subunit
MSLTVDTAKFKKRFQRLLDHWNSSNLWQDVDAIEISSGPLDTFSFLSQFHVWLFELEFSGTTLLITKEKIYFHTGKKKAEILSKVPDMELATFADMAKIPSKIGYYRDGENQEWRESIAPITQVDITLAIQDLLAVKDKDEIEMITQSANNASRVFNYMLKELENIILNDVVITHEAFASNVEKHLFSTNQKDVLDVVFPPKIQSGSKFVEDQVNNSNTLSSKPNTGILAILGVKYKGYCSMLGRTFMIDSSVDDEGIYKKMVQIFEFIVKKMTVGTKLSKVYDATMEQIKTLLPDTLVEMPSLLGFGIGIAEEKYLTISPDNQYVIRSGNVFVIKLKFETQSRTLYICDTIAIGPIDPYFLTQIPRSFTDISYGIEEEEDAEIEDEIEDLDKANILETKRHEKESAEQLLKQRQSEILKKNQEAPKSRQVSIVNDKKYSIDESLATGEIFSYKDPSEIKKSGNSILVDEKHETILLLVNQIHVPFHIATIKNISKSEEGDYAVLRINFKQPTGTYPPFVSYPTSTFIKEISVRSKDPKNIFAVTRTLTLLKKKISDREKELVEQRDLVRQEPLKIKGQSKIRLRDVYIRPNPKGKKTLGVIEAHENGLRFIAKEEIDILYSNIKHAIYQEAKDDIIVLVHFHLHHPIMIGKKKHTDIQFYAEVMEEVDQLVGNKRKNTTDMESVEEEKREGILRAKLNAEFFQFAKKVEEKSGIEFDSPYFQLGFIGTPNRSSVKIAPTVHTLVNLTEMPFFLVTIEDIELAYFERVSHGLKNFDLVLVFKDYTKPVVNIASIPMKSLDVIKKWLSEVGIKYFEGAQSLVWAKVLKTIREEEDWEPWGENGWNDILNTEAADDEEIDEDPDVYEEEGEGSEVEGSASGSAAEDSDDFESDEESEEEEFAGENDLSDDEVGASWDELEEKASKHDKERDLSDSDEAPVAKKKKFDVKKK